MPSVEQILIATTPASPMENRTAVRAAPGKGLEGDRYFIGAGTFSPNPQKPDFEITLIEKEKVEDFARESGLPFTTSHARRNIVTVGVDLNAFGGREFFVGQVRIRGIRLCEPCTHLAEAELSRDVERIVTQGPLASSDFVRRHHPHR
jgi:MOSC domain-containing protein YiiM